MVEHDINEQCHHGCDPQRKFSLRCDPGRNDGDRRIRLHGLRLRRLSADVPRADARVVRSFVRDLPVVCACPGRLSVHRGLAMLIRFKCSALKEGHWYEYALRFILGGAATVVAGLIAKVWGPGVGGSWPFPRSSLPASPWWKSTSASARSTRVWQAAGADGMRRLWTPPAPRGEAWCSFALPL